MDAGLRPDRPAADNRVVAQQGPELARYHGTVAALCDYLLDQPQVELSRLGPPAPRLHPLTQSWWELEEQVRRLLRGKPK